MLLRGSWQLSCSAPYPLPVLPASLSALLLLCLNDRIYWLVNFFIISLNLIYPESCPPCSLEGANKYIKIKVRRNTKDATPVNWIGLLVMCLVVKRHQVGETEGRGDADKSWKG